MEDLPVHPDAAVFMEKYRAVWEAGEFSVIGIKAAKK